MSDVRYLKSPCQKCGEHIEFPAVGIGVTIDCPHCGQKTTLVSTSSAVAATPPPETSGAKIKRKFPVVSVSIFLVLILAVTGASFYWSKRHNSHGLSVTHRANNTAPKPAQAVERHGDFVVGRIQFEKTEGSGLVYAVGTLKNKSARQRFGVRIELDLLDKQENTIGSASDYIAILDPHKDWQFRALLAEPKAVKVRVKNIEEQK
jgi:hypothetical protein